jgi:transaldolase/glucose-6-phosphate isomerase
MNSIKEAQRLGQDIWLDYIQRGLISSGEFQRYIEQGISGVTSNPTIFEKAITGNSDYDKSLLTLARENKDKGEIYEALVLQDIGAAADTLRPVYEDSRGEHGYVSLEVNPKLAYDTGGTIEEGLRLFAELNRPNIMIKVPATVEGVPAIRRLVAEGINVNVTLLFSLDSYQQSADAYIEGLEELTQQNGDVSTVTSVASLFISRIDTAVDMLLDEHIQQGQEQLKTLRGRAGIATAKLLYQAYKDTFSSERFAKLKARGARVQRPLWASTSTKSPAYSDLLYVEPLIGPNTINTMPPGTITAFLEHGKVRDTLEENLPDARRIFVDLEATGINMESVTRTLLDKGVSAFIDSFDKLLVGITEKSGLLTKGQAN